MEEQKPNYPEGPYYVRNDTATDCPAHSNSGLALVDTLVDTRRDSDWPVARLCEWPMARRIALALNCHDQFVETLKACEVDLSAAVDRLPKRFSDRADYHQCVALLDRIHQTLARAEKIEGEGS